MPPANSPNTQPVVPESTPTPPAPNPTTPPNAPVITPDTSVDQPTKATLALVLSIVGLITSPLLYLGLPVSIAALTLGIIGMNAKAQRAKPAIIISAIALLACVVVGIPFTRGFNSTFFGDHTPSKCCESAVNKNYTIDSEHVEFTPPANWTDNTAQTKALAAFISPQTETTPGGDFHANITLLSENIDSLLAQNDTTNTDESMVPVYKAYLASALASSAKALPDYHEISTSQVQLDGHAEVSYIVESTYTYTGGIPLHLLQLVDVENGKMYIMTGTAPDANWSSYSNTLDKTLRSFKTI